MTESDPGRRETGGVLGVVLVAPGGNENMNGLLGDSFPRGTDLSPHTSEDLTQIAGSSKPSRENPTTRRVDTQHDRHNKRSASTNGGEPAPSNDRGRHEPRMAMKSAAMVSRFLLAIMFSFRTGYRENSPPSRKPAPRSRRSSGQCRREGWLRNAVCAEGAIYLTQVAW